MSDNKVPDYGATAEETSQGEEDEEEVEEWELNKVLETIGL